MCTTAPKEQSARGAAAPTSPAESKGRHCWRGGTPLVAAVPDSPASGVCVLRTSPALLAKRAKAHRLGTNHAEVCRVDGRTRNRNRTPHDMHRILVGTCNWADHQGFYPA